MKQSRPVKADVNTACFEQLNTLLAQTTESFMGTGTALNSAAIMAAVIASFLLEILLAFIGGLGRACTSVSRKDLLYVHNKYDTSFRCLRSWLSDHGYRGSISRDPRYGKLKGWLEGNYSVATICTMIATLGWYALLPKKPNIKPFGPQDMLINVQPPLCSAEDYMEPLTFLERILVDLAEEGLITQEGLEAAGAISMTVFVGALAAILAAWLAGSAAAMGLVGWVQSLFVTAGVAPGEAAIIASALVMAAPTACAEEPGCGDGPPCEGETPHCCNEECQEFPCDIPDITAYDAGCCIGNEDVTDEYGTASECGLAGGIWGTDKCGGVEVVK